MPYFIHSQQIQVGKYQGQTFRWLLSNDVGWTAAILASHQRERESGSAAATPLNINKDRLLSYALLFPEVEAVIREKRLAPLPVSRMHRMLVGFGEWKEVTMEDFYTNPKYRQ